MQAPVRIRAPLHDIHTSTRGPPSRPVVIETPPDDREVHPVPEIPVSRPATDVNTDQDDSCKEESRQEAMNVSHKIRSLHQTNSDTGSVTCETLNIVDQILVV